MKIQLLNVGGPNTSPLEYGAGVEPKIMGKLMDSYDTAKKENNTGHFSYDATYKTVFDGMDITEGQEQEIFSAITNYAQTPGGKTRFFQSIMNSDGEFLNPKNLNKFITNLTKGFPAARTEFMKDSLNAVKDSDCKAAYHVAKGQGADSLDGFYTSASKPRENEQLGTTSFPANSGHALYTELEGMLPGDNAKEKMERLRKLYFRIGFTIGQVKILNYMQKFLTEDSNEKAEFVEVLPDLIETIAKNKKLYLKTLLEGMKEGDVLLLNEMEDHLSPGGTSIYETVALFGSQFHIVVGEPNGEGLASAIVIKRHPDKKDPPKKVELLEEAPKDASKCIAESVFCSYDDTLYGAVHCSSHGIDKGPTKRTGEIKKLLEFLKRKNGKIVLGIDTNDFNFTTNDISGFTLLGPADVNENLHDNIKEIFVNIEKEQDKEKKKKELKNFGNDTYFSSVNYTVNKSRSPFQAQESKAGILDLCTKDLILGLGVGEGANPQIMTGEITDGKASLEPITKIEFPTEPKVKPDAGEGKSLADKVKLEAGRKTTIKDAAKKYSFPNANYPFDHAIVITEISGSGEDFYGFGPLENDDESGGQETRRASTFGGFENETDAAVSGGRQFRRGRGTKLEQGSGPYGFREEVAFVNPEEIPGGMVGTRTQSNLEAVPKGTAVRLGGGYKLKTRRKQGRGQRQSRRGQRQTRRGQRQSRRGQKQSRRGQKQSRRGQRQSRRGQRQSRRGKRSSRRS